MLLTKYRDGIYPERIIKLRKDNLTLKNKMFSISLKFFQLKMFYKKLSK